MGVALLLLCFVYQEYCEWGAGEKSSRRELGKKLGQIIKYFGPRPASGRARKAAKQNCTLMWMVVEITRTQTTTALIISLPFFIKWSLSPSLFHCSVISLFPSSWSLFLFPSFEKWIKENRRKKLADMSVFLRVSHRSLIVFLIGNDWCYSSICPCLLTYLPRQIWDRTHIQHHEIIFTNQLVYNLSNQTYSEYFAQTLNMQILIINQINHLQYRKKDTRQPTKWTEKLCFNIFKIALFMVTESKC